MFVCEFETCKTGVWKFVLQNYLKKETLRPVTIKIVTLRYKIRSVPFTSLVILIF